MSQLEEARRPSESANDAVHADGRASWPMYGNWPAFVVVLAFSCSLAWIYFWLWAIVSTVQTAFF
jgi:hypothetical protein